jgi:uncharacterized protein YqeY
MLTEKLKKDMTDALKAGDKEKVSCLRVLLSAIKNKEVALRKPLDDQEATGVLRTEIKQVNESYEQFGAAGRTDLAESERLKLEILKTYLPSEITDDELTALIDSVVAETGATKKDMGKVMKLVLSKAAGRADGKKVNNLVNSRLS